ncbi:hypothetical protein AB0M10_18415 [Streptomyces sp. NPDC051840]|uniref:hypothetical protein n=1 Tax=Streptomyces sp. NPDC051840 TaxID=3154752 RepID=UPI00342474B9
MTSQPPGELIAWASSLVGPVRDAELISTSNSRVWAVRDAAGARYALKHLLDTSSMPRTENLVRSALPADAPLCRLLGAQQHPDGTAFLLSEHVAGPTLDQRIDDASDDTSRAWARELVRLLDLVAAVPVTGFGKLPDGLEAGHPSWSAFLRDYLAEQRDKAPGLASLRHAGLHALLDSAAGHLDAEVPVPRLVAADINNRNFVVTDRGPVCVNLPVLWAGDPLFAHGQALLHRAGTAGAAWLADRYAGWRLHLSAAYHAYVVLAYVERFAGVPLEEATPWGRQTPLLELHDRHLELARAGLAAASAPTGGPR